MKAIGLDIGTTTVCGVLWNEGGITPEKKLTLSNDTFISTEHPYEKLQDPTRILEKCQYILDTLQEGILEPISCIGVTGQMHGIVYVDANGYAVSPLFTWQDGRGDLAKNEKENWAQCLARITGYGVATGFGAVTHYFNTHNNGIPEDAVSFCTIVDYIAMRLADRKTPLLHPSMAASLGLYGLKEKQYNENAVLRSGMDISYFPEVAQKEQYLGYWKGEVPVAVAFGDNQASFLGSVEDGGKVLLNVGTGSQISILGREIRSFDSLECRPYIGDSYLYVGASLCGGRAYALLKAFYEDVLKMCGFEVPEDLYQRMNEAAAAGLQADDSLVADVHFSGSRKDPSLRGSICNMNTENFRADRLTAGILQGICQELFDFYRQADMQTPPYIVGSGNGIRNNPVMCQLLAKQFKTELRPATCPEEAACGAAKFALLVCNH